MRKKTKPARRMRRYMLAAACMALVLGLAIGGTVAWLVDTTDTVTNTFDPSDVDITLTETGATGDNGKLSKQFKMIPGTTEDKDPKVTVEIGSEPCWVFVTVEEKGGATYGFDAFVGYKIATGWKELESVSTETKKVYYRKCGDLKDDEATTDVDESAPLTQEVTYAVLADNKVSYPSDVTKAMMDAIDDGNKPQLIFEAYAIQQAAVADAATAWQNLNGQIGG